MRAYETVEPELGIPQSTLVALARGREETPGAGTM